MSVSRASILSLILMCWASLSHADWADTKGLLSLQTESFLSPDYEATGLKDYGFVAAGLRTSGLGPDNRFEKYESGLQASVDGQFSPETPVLSYLNVRQLYHQQSMISVGRKLQNWSDLDEHWHLGLYQPQFRWNPLLPESQGLSGLFLKMEGDSKELPWGLLVFGSPVFIPDQGAGYSIKNGQFESANPWFHAPATSAQFETTGAIDRIQYDVQKPDTNKIVFNSSYAAQIYIGQKNDGFSAQAAYAYKPANQLSLGFDSYLNTNHTASVQISPTIAYHSLLSTDLLYTGKVWEFGVGALQEKMTDPEFESQWTYQSYGESHLVSPFIGFRWEWVKVRLMSISVDEPTETAMGPKAEQLGSVLPHRYPFSNAYAAEVSSRFFWKKHNGIEGKARYTQGAEDEFSMANFDLNYQMDARWKFSGGLLVVRADSSPATVYSEYENNDMAQVGVQYVF